MAGGSVGRRRGSGSPATGLAGGGAVWCGFFFLRHVAVGFLSKEQTPARRRRRWCKIDGRRRAGSPRIGRPAGARQGRPMRWRTGLPHARRLLRPLVAGGGQGHSKMDGRPATARVALFFPGPPLVPPPCGCYAEAPLVRYGALGALGGLATRAAKWAAGGGRRRFGIGPAAATVRWHWCVDHREGCGERQQALWMGWRSVYRSMQSFGTG